MTVSRRNLLRGFGTVVALPFLESLEARAQSTAPRKQRFIGYMTPNGVNTAEWDLDAQATRLTDSVTVSSLARHHKRFALVTGLHCRHRPDGGTGAHQRGVSGFLTAATCIRESLKLCIDPPHDGFENCTPAGISLDQLLAQGLAPETRYRSLEFGPANNEVNAGGCGEYTCAYGDNISWRDGSTPLARTVSPARAFDRLFAGANAAETLQARAQRMQRRTRVLDFVKDDAQRLSATLGRDDRRRVDQYFTALSELESDLGRGPATAACSPSARPGLDSPSVDDPTPYIDAFHRVMALALSCDLTRVMTFMVGGGGNLGSYKYTPALRHHGPRTDGSWRFLTGEQSRIEEAKHHDLSHWLSDAGFEGGGEVPDEYYTMKRRALGLIDRHLLSRFGVLLDALAAVDDGDGHSLLDNTLIYYSSELSDGHSHSTENLPILLAGGAAGRLKGDRVVSASGTVANLHIAIARTFGLDVTRFGNDGDRPLAGVF